MAQIKVTVANNMTRKTVIIDSSTTLKQALEDAGIDYTVGVTNLDGSSLGAGEINKTFDDFGVKEKAFLMNVVKTDNAVNVTIAGQAAVITSSLKLEDIKTVAKYRPKALTLYGGEDGKEPIFALGVGSNSITKYGVSFNSATRDDEKKATLTEVIDYNGEDVEGYISDKYGVAIVNLGKLEAALPAVIDEINAEKAAIAANITVVG